MGRPLNKKYFANTNYDNEGVGGEGVASVTVVAGDSAGYDDTTDTVAFSAPQIAGGQTATGTLVVTGGAVTGVTVTDSGSGYTSAPTLTITTVGGTETTLTLTAVLTTSRQNGIAAYAWVNAKTNGDLNNTAGGGSSVGGDIIKQVNGNVYKVQTAQGTGRCILVAAAPAEPTVLGELGQMTITATDSSGKTYYVTKLTSRTAVLEPYGAAGHEWPLVDGLAQRVRWSFDAAVAIGSTNSKVQIANN